MSWRTFSGIHYLMFSLPTAPVLSLGHHCLEGATLNCNLGLILGFLLFFFSHLGQKLVSTKISKVLENVALYFFSFLMLKPQPKPSVFLGDGQSVLPHYLLPLIHFQLLLHDLRA